MKKLILLLLLALPGHAPAQSCDKKSCGPEGTKTGEAAAISNLRSDLKTAISRMSQSSVPFDKAVLEMEISTGGTDDESLLYISQAATVVRTELVTKVEPTAVLPKLKEFKAVPGTNKQQLMAGLKKEVQLLVDQTERL